MYIKIKHIKISLLVLACILFAGVNYFTHVKADDTTPTNTTSSPDTSSSVNSDSVTASFSESLNEFIQSKGNQITADDLKSFSQEQVTKLMGDPLTFDTLPQIDISKIKILKQPYSTLSDSEKKAKELADANTYISNILYLLLSNSPTPIATREDAESFYQDFLTKIGDPTSNSDYFSDLGTRLSLFNEQIANIEVPETMLNLHIKFLRLINSTLALKEESLDSNDPIASAVALGKANQILELFVDFVANDVSNYFKTLDSQ